MINDLPNLLKLIRFKIIGQAVYNQFDPDNVLDRQKFTLFRIYSLSGALVSLGVFIKMWLMFTQIKPIHYVLPLLSLGMLINFYRITLTTQLKNAYLIVLSSSFLLLHIVSYSTGGIRSASSLYYTAIIFLAFMLSGKRTGIFFTLVFCVQMIYIFIVSRYTDLVTYNFLNTNTGHIEEDFLFNSLFTSFLISAQCIYYFTGRNIVIQKITEQRDKLEESNRLLQQTNTELNKTNKELDKFVYSVSHDLRAPLSSMLGILQLTREDVTDELTGQSLDMIKTSILKLDTFIMDILDYSRNARVAVRKDTIWFNEMLDGLLKNIKYMDSKQDSVQKRISVIQSTPFYSDKRRLEVIFNNLISNAIRYSSPILNNSYLYVQVNCTEEKAVIEIADNGIGIKPEYHEKIFDMFYRVSEESVGSGLGLYLVKETVEKLSGQIQITSIPEQGTKFTITLPALH